MYSILVFNNCILYTDHVPSLTNNATTVCKWKNCIQKMNSDSLVSTN